MTEKNDVLKANLGKLVAHLNREGEDEAAALVEQAISAIPNEEGECELCGAPLRLGQFVNQYDDIGTAHANCERPFAKPSEETPAPGDDGSTMPTYVLLGEPPLLEGIATPRPTASADVVGRCKRVIEWLDEDDGEHQQRAIPFGDIHEIARAALSASPVQELVEALEPFAEFADPRKVMPPDLRITQGSEMAKRQLTMGDCYRAAATLAKVRDQ